MTIARSHLVNPEWTRWYHCVSRCVRHAFLLSTGKSNRKQWIEDRLKELSKIFAVSVGGFSIMDNHLHVLVRLDPDEAMRWLPTEVAAKWYSLHPPRDKGGKRIELNEELIQSFANDEVRVNLARIRLASLSWFMKCLKEPLARLANAEDGCTGAFFAGRFKSHALLDEEALLTVATYIDLNPVAAGVSPLPESSPHTSFKIRIEHVSSNGELETLGFIEQGSVPAMMVSDELEDDLWLVPIEDRRRFGGSREGFREGFTLAQYALLVDFSSRIFRPGKKSLSDDTLSIFERLGCQPDRWQERICRLHKSKWIGSFLGSSKSTLNNIANSLGTSRVLSVT